MAPHVLDVVTFLGKNISETFRPYSLKDKKTDVARQAVLLSKMLLELKCTLVSNIQ